MAGMNKVFAMGNLGRDPEVRDKQSGMAICNLSLAVNERVKEGDQWKDHVEWIRVVTFGKTAENVGKYCTKGKQVLVEGKLRTKKYKNKDGVEVSSTEVVADNVQFLGGGKEAGGRPAAPAPDSDPFAAPPGGDGFVDDDLPF